MSHATPPEVWTEVFSGLPAASLAAVVATSRGFATVGRPLRFARFLLTPYSLLGYADNPLRYEVETGDAFRCATERLDFWTSEDIAPLVRSCRISTSDSWSESEGPTRVTEDETELVVLNMFFARLQRFTHLRSLELVDISLPADALRKISALPKISAIDIQWSIKRLSLDALSAPVPPSRIEKFSLFAYPLFDYFGPLLPLLNPATLKDLSLRCPLLSWTASPEKIPTFPAVFRLYIFHAFSTDYPVFYALLPKFPRLETLEVDIVHPDVLADVLAGCRAIFSHIKKLFTASHRLIAPFLQQSPRLRVLVCPDTVEKERLFAPLRANTCPALGALSVHLEAIRLAELAPLWTCCPNLAHLQIYFEATVRGTGEDTDDIAIAFLNMLADGGYLGPALRTLVLVWHFVDPDGDTTAVKPARSPATAVLTSARALIAERHPALTAIGLDTGTCVLQWRGRAHDRYTVVEECSAAWEGEVFQDIKMKVLRMWEEVEREELGI
ncbi:hypothetical protein MIND_01338800 [Mycena indigotica]|uniref:F-box domain-containing protein n=1 Tax=Mycena indigotica TaxID=2126181 RepID=A0A8H6VSD2_9AGAR|nr:uncharacterized protein MIND_01338800 [Mycena indigotica]KAF7290251.1 hypothetical protein MIND_01338800 [Mycena indigotica]